MASVGYFFVTVAITAILVSDVTVQARSFKRFPRADQEETTLTKSKLCYKTAPCGWSIYVPFTREIVDYMPNTCTCPQGLSCVRADDDLSVSAYVHRCRSDSEISGPDDNLQSVYL